MKVRDLKALDPTKPLFVRIRTDETHIILEAIHPDEDHTNVEEWGIARRLNKGRLKKLPQNEIDEQIISLKREKKAMIDSGRYQDYPY